MWGVRADYPSKPIVDEFDTEAEAQAARQRHRATMESIAVTSHAPPGSVVPAGNSFNSQGRNPMGHLLAGPASASIAICDHCLAKCNEILAGRLGSG